MSASAEVVTSKVVASGVSPEAEDVIVETIAKVVGLEKDAIFDLIPSLLDSADHMNFELGCALSQVQNEKWWQDDGFESFKECIEGKFGIEYRKAMYLVSNYNYLAKSEVPWTAVSGIGWTKLKELAPILTLDNVEEWVKTATELTTLQLHEAVKQFKAGSLEKSGTESGSTEVTTLTFKVHPDQKVTIQTAVDKAKDEAETEFATVALEAICMSYMAGGKAPPPPTLKAIMEKNGWEEVLEVFDGLWPDIDVKVKITG